MPGTRTSSSGADAVSCSASATFSGCSTFRPTTSCWTGLEADAAAHHASYTFRQYAGPLPDDLLQPVSELRGAVQDEAPTGEIEREPATFDAAQARADEVELEAMGRTRYCTVAFAPDGTAAGYTDVVVPTHDPDCIYQWGTLVWPAHRGYRLGLALKVRNTRWVLREVPGRRAIRTWNAEVNAPMIVVNDAIGYRAVERTAELQKRLD